MTGTYVAPADVAVSDTWWGHKNRPTPSAEPGTDYATPYGTALHIAEAGVVSVIDGNPDGGEGRRLSVDLYDGRRVSYIHLSGISAYIGQPVERGQLGLIWSGASGYGEDWYYGPHVHVSLWEHPGMSYADTIDFEPFVGGVTTPAWEGDDDMIIIQGIERGIALVGPGYFRHIQPSELEFAGALATKHLTGGDHEFDQWKGLALHGEAAVIPNPVQPNTMVIIEGVTRGIALIGPGYFRHIQPHELEFAGSLATKHLKGGDHEFDQWRTLALDGQGAVSVAMTPVAESASTRLVTPAWIGTGALALIGIVEVIRFIVDRLV